MNAWDYITQLFGWLRGLFDGTITALPSWAVVLLDGIIGIILILSFFTTTVMIFIWLERRLIGRFQIRLGPNRAGRFGLLQPVADAIKVLIKEDIVPARGDKWVHWLAPVVVFVPALMLFAVIPIAPTYDGANAILADLNIGILYIIAIGTLGVIGIFMAGWASNNKYSLVGAMRAVAQMISYEIPMVLSIIGVLLMVGSLQMGRIVAEQSIPFILLQPLGFLIYFIGASAELNRCPMDLLEAESEIVAGYHTEYSGIKFSLFYLAEYGNALAISAIIATLFLAGWKQPFSQELFILPPWLWFVVKVFTVFFVIMWMRSTLPRLRVDQLMGFAWKFLLPLALINIFITGIEVLFWPTSLWALVPINIAIAGGLIFLWSRLFFKLGGGRVEVGV
jgi:NADH-quinone oxidoreductase subunit H